VNIVLKTDDGAIIYVTYNGVIHRERMAASILE
jgi:hypothetical protein